MAELTIPADDIQSAIEEYVSSFTADTSREEVGTVVDAGDGIAHVEGLPSVMTQELLEFPRNPRRRPQPRRAQRRRGDPR